MKRIALAFFTLALFALTAGAQMPVGEEPEANPGRPTVSTPATLTPAGYLQFETGLSAANHSPEFSSRFAPSEVTIFVGRVERRFRRRQREDQPTMTRIHGFEPKHVAEKCAVRLGVFTVDNHVSARNHLPSKYPRNL